jgi:hypothetical protein
VPKGQTDVKFAVELGFSIMLDKPIIAVVMAGTQVPAKLLKIADEIIEAPANMNLDGDPEFGARMAAAISRVTGEVYRRKPDDG